ncbi:MAG: hypothetical protein VYD77_03850 [Actinomycetota bacterium]|nr:hypothetical protein [Actinomycetota bacterium]|tara:strand:- start:483 stop:950 length:468 start_codon:yes stop_codon:yes gene_type:complete
MGPAPQTPESIEQELDRRGHIVTSWEELGSVTIEATGIETSSYRIGLPSKDASPTVFKAYFPPDCRVEAHTHACDYSEIILEGSQKVSGKWLYPGDIRVGLANKGYGPLIAGPEGVTVLVIFADGHWPAITIGKGDGSTLGTGELLDRFSAADSD